MGWNIDLPPAEWIGLGDRKLEEVINAVIDQPVVALDTETTGLNVMKDIPLFWSLSWGHRRICMPAGQMHHFGRAFKDTSKEWVFANAKYDMHMLAQVGIAIQGKCIDTQVMHALLYEEQPHKLKMMAKQVLGWGWRDFFDTFDPKNVLDELKDQIDSFHDDNAVDEKPKRKIKPATRKETIGEMLLRFEQENLQALVEYASNDAYGTFQIYLNLKKQLQEEMTFSLYPDKFKTMWDIFYKTECPFTKVLWKCERNGILIDADYLKKIEGPVEGRIQRIEREVAQITGRVMNLNSTPELRDYFFKEKGYKPIKLTPGKQASTDYDVLQELAVFDPVAKKTLEYRDLDKLLGTYVMGLKKHLDQNNRIHCKFNQDIARTGRLSSSGPNLQNIPKPESDNFKIRAAFIPPEGYDLIVIDYDQLEMRLLAAAAQEPDMVNIFLSGRDIHMGNAELVFGPIYEKKYGRRLTYADLKDAKSIDKQVKNGELPESAMTQWVHLCLFARNAIKSVGFGLNYGMKEKKLGNQLGIPKEEALEIIDAYMATYPTVKHFFSESVENCRKYLKSWTILGRRRFLPEINAYNSYERFQAERRATNNEIQGTAADVVRMAMITLDDAQLDYHYGCDMLLQVHDELVFQCPKESTKECMAEIKEYMEHPFDTDLDVPLTASAGSGPSWMHAK